eukprot:5148331-Amphidinium_carterae.1
MPYANAAQANRLKIRASTRSIAANIQSPSLGKSTHERVLRNTACYCSFGPSHLFSHFFKQFCENLVRHATHALAKSVHCAITQCSHMSPWLKCQKFSVVNSKSLRHDSDNGQNHGSVSAINVTHFRTCRCSTHCTRCNRS